VEYGCEFFDASILMRSMNMERWLDSWYLSFAPSNEEVRIADTIPYKEFGSLLPEMFNNDPACLIDTLLKGLWPEIGMML